MTDADGHTTTYAYNARNELAGMTDPANQGTGQHYVYTYDADGNLMTADRPARQHDDLQLRRRQPPGDGDRPHWATTTTYVYDADGELDVRHRRRTTTPTTYTYDSLGQVLTETATSGGSGGGDPRSPPTPTTPTAT